MQHTLIGVAGGALLLAALSSPGSGQTKPPTISARQFSAGVPK